MNIKNLLRINHLLLAATLLLPFTVNELLCHSSAGLGAGEARKIVRQWYKNRAAIDKGCQKQTTLALQKTLKELKIKKELWDVYTGTQRKHYCALTVHYYEKLCDPQAAGSGGKLGQEAGQDVPPELAGKSGKGKGQGSGQQTPATGDDLPTGIAGPGAAPGPAAGAQSKGKLKKAKNAPAAEVQLCRLELGISGTAQGQSPLPGDQLADTTRTHYGYEHWIMGFGLAGSFVGAVTKQTTGKPENSQPVIQPKNKKTKTKAEAEHEDLLPIAVVLIVLLHTISALSQVIDFLVTMAGKTFKGQVIVKLLVMIFPFLVMFDLTGVGGPAVDYSYGFYLFIVFAMLNVGLLMDAQDSGLKSLIKIRREEKG